jgi:GDP-D-mannose 3', 5'-epimerase
LKIVVTGGAGMIGSNLVRRLTAAGNEVVVVDNLWRGTLQNVEWAFRQKDLGGSFVQLDLASDPNVGRVFEGADVVYHLADVVAGIDYVFSHEYSIWRENIAINSRTLSAAIEAGVPRFIYVGTACSYPEHLTKTAVSSRPIIEEDAYPANPESAYGWSKLMGEYEIGLAEQQGLVNAVVLRLHNVFGFPTELSPERSQVIPALLRKVSNYPKEEFLVWGTGGQRRSFVWVEDVVDALELALTHGAGAGAIQIGPPQSTSIREIAETIAKLSGKNVTPRYDTSRPEGDLDRVGNFAKASEVLGWSPKTDLESGLAQALRWVQTTLESSESI